MKNKKLKIIIILILVLGLSLFSVIESKHNSAQTEPNTEPTNHVEETKSKDHVEETDPTEPTDHEDKTNPTDPTEPTNHVEETENTYETNPTEPTDHEDKTNSTSPIKLENTNITDGTDKQNNEHIGEIELNGSDGSMTYTVLDGTSVKYNGITFDGLYTCINTINTKYDANTIINFIIKTYSGASKLVYTDVETDELNTSSGDSVDFTIDDELEGYGQYEYIKSKYNNAPVTWKLTLTDSETMYPTYIYGCETYMLMTGTNGDIRLDMSAYDSGLNIYSKTPN